MFGMVDVMYVVFGDDWQVEVDYQWYFFDIQVMCGYVGGYQQVYFVGFELL